MANGMTNKYTKEQIKAMYDLCDEFRDIAYTTGEVNRLEEAKANLLNRHSLAGRLDG